MDRRKKRAAATKKGESDTKMRKYKNGKDE